ncbi:uncharacterized protein G6M90_00g093790 [Metarhizium brunneum]|uniref:Rhodopsin domain-containing protein n=1 Tax=Metarhizium brunneum TaxID=500148 RepID=A0A7D5YYL4_9HYPO|nr:hypothetical protein G6M90_00g093790 [Metarhizium brunneum]
MTDSVQMLCLAFTVMTITCVSGGAFGEEAWNVVLSSFTKSQLVLGLLVEVVSPLAICFVKISVFILYLQLFSVLQWMRVVSITGIVVISVWHLSISIAFAVMCSPTGSSQLDFLAALVSPMCTRTRSLVVTQGVGNVVTDVFPLVLIYVTIGKAKTQRAFTILSLAPIQRRRAIHGLG